MAVYKFSYVVEKDAQTSLRGNATDEAKLEKVVRSQTHTR
jgi:hypothetical protein